MKLLLKILKFSLIGITILILIVFVCVFIFYKFFYYHELNSIKKDIQKNENIEIIKIWGNEDVTFEDVYAILKIKNKGNISIYNLSSDVNNFPKDVYIGEIGNHTFVNFICENAMSWNLNIGTESDFEKKTGIKFNKVDDIVNHYDDIIKYVETFKTFPNYNFLDTKEDGETILFVDKNNSMNHNNLKKYYNSECVADLQNEINKTWKKKNCR